MVIVIHFKDGLKRCIAASKYFQHNFDIIIWYYFDHIKTVYGVDVLLQVNNLFADYHYFDGEMMTLFKNIAVKEICWKYWQNGDIYKMMI